MQQSSSDDLSSDSLELGDGNHTKTEYQWRCWVYDDTPHTPISMRNASEEIKLDFTGLPMYAN